MLSVGITRSRIWDLLHRLPQDLSALGMPGSFFWPVQSLWLQRRTLTVCSRPSDLFIGENQEKDQKINFSRVKNRPNRASKKAAVIVSGFLLLRVITLGIFRSPIEVFSESFLLELPVVLGVFSIPPAEYQAGSVCTPVQTSGSWSPISFNP